MAKCTREYEKSRERAESRKITVLSCLSGITKKASQIVEKVQADMAEHG